MQAFDRVKKLIGLDKYNVLKNSYVAVFGIGGVGGIIVEALVRSGVQNVFVCDNDVVSITNLNRQVIANVNTVGQDKVSVIKEKMLSINPSVNIVEHKAFVLADTIEQIDFTKFDYVIDAVDTVTAKICIIEKAKQSGVKVISCMGTAGKLNPLDLRVADVSRTANCPLARVMRRELKKRNITGVKVVYSVEERLPKARSENNDLTDVQALENASCSVDEVNQEIELKGTTGREAPASMMFVPAVAGLVIASEVVKDLIG